MFSSEIYHIFQTARKQKTLPTAAGFRTRDFIEIIELLGRSKLIDLIVINYNCSIINL
jgi:hypothetical protein